MQREIRLRHAQVEDKLPDELSPLLRRIYLNRGVGEAWQLELSLKQLLPYHELKGIQAATSLLYEALQKQQHILIVGDFDADGATSTALAIRALKRFGAKHVSYIVPDRFRYGYGLTPEIVDVALQQSPDLIITVDNGISSTKGVARAKQAGVSVLITDHHLPGAELPSADAIVNPNQAGCEFPSKKLAGVGVIFYVMAGLRAYLRERGANHDENFSLAELLDLVALGTVADVVPLDHNNRILVQQGLLRIRSSHCCPGITALLQLAGREQTSITSLDLGFAVGPRLNAAGRMQDMSIGIECLLSDDPQQAHRFARELDAINRERRERQAGMQQQAVQSVSEQLEKVEELPYGLCVFDQDWHEGIVGLVASHLKEKYHRPCIAFAPAGEAGQLKGSARSIPGFHIRDCLDQIATENRGLISKFGGHAMAAGLSLQRDDLRTFQQAFNDTVRQVVDASRLERIELSDGELNADEISVKTAIDLAEAGPWGQNFPEPLFHGRFTVLEQRILKEKHLKLKLAVNNADEQSSANRSVDAIAFFVIDEEWQGCGSEIQISYRLSINSFRDQQHVQLIIEHIYS
ncbi:MAG: single-stranded-DNA-specific exonuclease RecJ [Salinisphaeraceae bacterium]|nr:single-stranded-DNA-specific exonuclease RecJ [Salinisphaeraceae bacterium]